MKKIFYIIVLALLSACGQRVSFDESIFDEVLYTPRYASGFDIRRHSESGATLITSTNPWQGADGVAYRLLIDPANHFSVSASGLQRITKHAERIICMSSSHIAMLSTMQEQQRVVGVSGIDFVSDEYINSHRTEIGDVGYDNNINYELLIALDPDLVLLYGINAANALEQKLLELGIPFAYIGEYVESSPLGKAEWMVAIGEIVGRREQSVTLFEDIASRYTTLSADIQSKIGEARRPQVMLNIPYRDAWFLPAKSSYMVQLIEDAGGKTFTTQGEDNTSEPIDIEQALLYASQSDMWLNPSGCNTIAELVALNPKFATVPPVTRGAVWNNNALKTEMGGSDFWESGVVRPDIILQDLATILHPELMEGNEFYYYKQLK